MAISAETLERAERFLNLFSQYPSPPLVRREPLEAMRFCSGTDHSHVRLARSAECAGGVVVSTAATRTHRSAIRRARNIAPSRSPWPHRAAMSVSLLPRILPATAIDRKSTRLNSSHVA